jgi:glycerol-3-phosphate dehydrogenase
MQYDLIIVGAGIQGAGVAQVAAAAGYSVLILEQTAIAAGTSSKSSKLIHGGLRYLETAQFALVRESLRERALLLKLAPELVQLKPLHIPLYTDSSRSPLTIRAGLSLYSALTGFSSLTRFESLPRPAWENLSGLRQDKLRAVFRYFEAQTDDAALTRAVIRSAQSLGAELQMPARFLTAEYDAHGCYVDYETGGRQTRAHGRVLVNCGGPWATDIHARIQSAPPLPAVDLVQGSHLLLPPVVSDYFYLESPGDKRAIFALPWQGRLLLGTTEVLHRTAPDRARCSVAERDYLLRALHHYFPQVQIAETDVDSFAGLRVLPHSDGVAFKRSRDVLLWVDNEAQPRVMALMGGKLTTYRATAESALARIRASLPAKTARADTASLPLTPDT